MQLQLMMWFPTSRLALVAACAAALALMPMTAIAEQQSPQQSPQQSHPTPDQARQMLQANPELVQQLRARLLNSGLTVEQIHERLRAEGYPEDMLDAYLPGSNAAAAQPTSDTYKALRDLGVADSSDVAFYRALASDTLTASARDSLIRTRDSLYRVDTLALGREPRRLVVRADVEDSLIRLDSGYNIFGLAMFRAANSRFEPLLAGPVDANYRLGPGDRMVLILTGDIEASYTLDVTREGFIVIPQVGQLDVANLTLADLNNLLYSRLGRVYSGVRRGAGATTHFSVSVARLRANQVFVLGEVQRPGSYMVSSAGTAMTALYAAGGPTANGSLRNVQIRRGNQQIASFDLYDYLLRGDATHDTRLETGDVLFVPPRGARVRVLGEVIRPATYEMKPGESLRELLQAAGGFRADAIRSRVQLERIVAGADHMGRSRVMMDVEAAADGDVPAVPVQSGDVVRVLRVPARMRNSVTVKGDVWSPGAQGLTPGMTIADALRLAGGPKPDVYLGQVLVERLHPDSTRGILRASLRDSTGAVINDFPLADDDIIRVFSVTDLRPERYVAIGGAVHKSGRFPYREGMTIRDLVLLAGGLTEGAYLKEAEVARLPEDRSGPATAITVRVPLDSSYVFERYATADGDGTPHPPPVTDEGFVLKPYDNVLIMLQPYWQLQRTVTIAGEVRFPGTYALKTRSEHLTDLIERAGGLTTDAYPEGTVFVRRKGDIGRIAIDVPSALRNGRSPENMLLTDGDSIGVPQRSYVVTVRGAVNAANVVAYVPGEDIDYYISQAGGPAKNADDDRAFVTQPSGKRETKHRFGQPKPLPGSLVVVPETDPADRFKWQQTFATMAPILASLATVIIALRR